MAEMHTLSVLVEDKPGVLMRVVALLAHRGFGIKSLTVEETEHPEISRMTIIVEVDEAPFEQVIKQLNKLVNVLKIVELDSEGKVERRPTLLKVCADETRRTNVLQVADLFRTHMVDVQTETVVIKSIGSLSKLEALLHSLKPFGVTEIIQSDAVAIGHGSRSVTDWLREK